MSSLIRTTRLVFLLSAIATCVRSPVSLRSEVVPFSNGVSQLLEHIDRRDQNAIFCLIGSQQFAKGVGITEGGDSISISVSPLGFKCARGPGTVSGAWQAGLSAMTSLAVATRFDETSGDLTGRIIFVQKREGVLVTHSVFRHQLPDAACRFIAFLPEPEVFSAEVAKFRAKSSVAKQSEAVVVTIADAGKSLLVMYSNGRIGSFEKSNEMWVAKEWRQSNIPGRIVDLMIERGTIAVVAVQHSDQKAEQISVEMLRSAGEARITGISTSAGTETTVSTMVNRGGNAFCTGSDGYLHRIVAGAIIRQAQQFVGPKRMQRYLINRDGKNAAIIQKDGGAVLWDCIEGREICELNVSGTIDDMQFSIDGTYLALVVRGESSARPPIAAQSIIVVDARTGKRLSQLRPFDSMVDQRIPRLHWSADSASIFAVGFEKSRANGRRGADVVHMWDVRRGRHLADFVAEIPLIDAIGLDFDGKRLIGCGKDGSIQEWSFADVRRPDAGE